MSDTLIYFYIPINVMKQRIIADKKVFPIGLGAMALDEYPPKPSEEDAVELLKYAVEKGIDFIDTADVYGLGRNEKLIGKLSNEIKEKILIATKVGCTRPDGYSWDTNGSKEHIKEGIQDSLKRLNLKQIYLYQLHAPDHRVSFKESIEALKELQNKKLIKHIGLSNVSLDLLKEAQKIVNIVSVQNNFNLKFKQDEEELLPYLTKNNIAFIPYFPLGGGRLLANPILVSISKELNLKPSQVALAWILNKWPTAVPIPGTRDKKHLDENIKAAEIELSKKTIEKLDSLF